jgi:hypothetical protein
VIVFRWIVGVLGALFALGSALSFVIFITSDVDVWIRRARRFRHWVWLILLLWFNVEVWGRVLYTIIHWHG